MTQPPRALLSPEDYRQRGACILALMSGTSVDTIDAAVCRVQTSPQGRYTCEVLAFHEHPMEDRLRQRIFQVFADGDQSLSLGCSLNFEIGEAFASAAQATLDAIGDLAEQVDVIASHGQTLYHIAPHMVNAPGRQWTASTLQVGESSVMALRTGRPVIDDFRVADMAAGGNGAPLVPFADYHLFSQPGKGIVVHNLGGIANCTWLPPSGNSNEVLAFDTGPANMIIDALVSHFWPGQSYDHDGEHAARGRVLSDLLAEWMSIPYIDAPPPKSTGRELFGVQFVQKILEQNRDATAEDLLATAVELTAQSFARNLALHICPRGKIDAAYLAGGGARNPFLVTRIQSALAEITPLVTTLDDAGSTITSKSRECAGFALMAYAHLLGDPANLPSVTGATRAVVLGKLTPGLG